MNQQIADAFVAASTEATEALDTPTRANHVLQILQSLHKRVNRSCMLVRDITSSYPGSFDAEMCCLLRVAYDGSLQALYIVHDRQQSEHRAREYREFADVERAKFLNIAQQSTSNVAAILRTPPNPQTEAIVLANIAAVKAKFTDSNGRLFTNWYRTNLEKLSKDSGYHDEYNFIIRCLHTAVHCTPLGTLYGSPVEGGLLTHLSFILPARILAAAVRYAQIQLSEGAVALFDHAVQPVTSFVPPM